MADKKYAGTKGLTMEIAINRIVQLFLKHKLNQDDDVYFEESINKLRQDTAVMEKNHNSWVIVEDILTANQWKKLWQKYEK